MRSLDVETVTRDPLLASVRETKGQSNDQYKMDRNVKAILRLVRREAKRDGAAARADLRAMIETLETALDDITNGNVERADVGSITTHFEAVPLHKRAPRPGSRVQA